jgi:tetratricopeptide (TPR) repeat protein
MLYELLAGERPWGDHTDPITLARQIGESEPEPPSAVRRRTRGQAEAAKRGLKTGWTWRLPRELSHDLDAIVLKALRVKPEERYESVQALAEDLGRYQTNRPVKAREGRTWYWLTKYVRRNWVPLAVTAGIVAMTTGYIVDRTQQLDKTERERAKVEQVRDFLIGLFREVQPAYTQGQNISAREMLDRGAKRLETNPPQDPVTRITLQRTLGETYMELGEYGSAGTYLRKAWDGAQSVPAGDEAQLADIQIKLAQNETWLNDPQAAGKYLTALMVKLKAARPLDHALLARALVAQAAVMVNQGHTGPELEQVLREASEHVEKVEPQGELRAAIELFYRHVIDQKMERHDELVQRVRLASDILSRIHGANHPEALNAVMEYGSALCLKGETGRGLDVLRGAVAEFTRILGADHLNTSSANNRLGVCLAAEDRWPEAAEIAAKRLELLRRNGVGSSSVNEIVELYNLIFIVTNTGDLDRAEKLMFEQRRLIEEHLTEPVRSDWRAQADQRRVAWLIAKGKLPEAEKLAEDTLRSAEGNPELAAVRRGLIMQLGDAAMKQGRYERAESLYRQALSKRLTEYRSKIRLASALGELGRKEEAEAILVPMLERMEISMSVDSPIKLRSRQVLARVRAARPVDPGAKPASPGKGP